MEAIYSSETVLNIYQSASQKITLATVRAVEASDPI
jgi:hypothetical protein